MVGGVKPLASLPRGIPAASLKEIGLTFDILGVDGVFRGEYPRPH